VTIAISAEIAYFTAAPHRCLAQINPASAALADYSNPSVRLWPSRELHRFSMLWIRQESQRGD